MVFTDKNINKISDWFLYFSAEHGDTLTNLKLQKLLYYSQGWHLALNDTPIFDEDLQAWVHGPVAPSQYHRFKDYSWGVIAPPDAKPKLDKTLEAHLVEVYKAYSNFSGYQLELMSHREAPWRDAREGLRESQPSSRVIEKDSMQKYFSKQLDGQ